MDPELRQYLIGMEERLASRGDLTALEDRLKRYVNERCELVETRLKEYVDERCESVETKLLTEFHKWSSPTEARNRSIAAALHALDLEQQAPADRVKGLEGRSPQ